MPKPIQRFENLIVCAITLGEHFDSLEGFFGADTLFEKIEAIWKVIDQLISKHRGALLSPPNETIQAAWSTEHAPEACSCAVTLISGDWRSPRDHGYFLRAGMARGRCMVQSERGRRTLVLGDTVNEALRLAGNHRLPPKRLYGTQDIIDGQSGLHSTLAAKGGLRSHGVRKDVFELKPHF